MRSESVKKNWQQNLHKIYLPKIHHFIAELMTILETDLAEIKQRSKTEISASVTMQTLHLEKKALIEMLSKAMELIARLNKFINSDKDQLIETSMLEDDQKIIDNFLNKILAKDLYAE